MLEWSHLCVFPEEQKLQTLSLGTYFCQYNSIQSQIFSCIKMQRKELSIQ